MTAIAETRISAALITRSVPAAIIVATGPTTLGIRAGTTIEINGRLHAFEAETPVTLGDMVPGSDYGVGIAENGAPFAALVGSSNPVDEGWFAGFHFAPGGNASARSGGDAVPAINPFSLWDIGFRPSCPDPRGMALVDMPGHRFWTDIYLTGVGHGEHGTSRFGVEIADGRSLSVLDFPTASGIYAAHGKRPLTYDEFRAAAFGVTERSSAPRDPGSTGLDAPRTSRFGLMQAAGNLWVWGTDGDPEDPRPSIFGGSWILGSDAGSRYASLVYWPEPSFEFIGARACCDHLNPA